MGSFFLEISQETVNTVVRISLGVVGTIIGSVGVWLLKILVNLIRKMAGDISDIKTQQALFAAAHENMKGEIVEVKKRVDNLEDEVFRK